MNFAIYVSGNAGRLRKIIQNREKFIVQIKLVVSDDIMNFDIRDSLSEMGINYFLIDYTKLSGNKNIALSEQMLELFQEFKIDYCFSFGDHILKGNLLEVYKEKIINFHPSILPMFKGRKAIDQAIETDTFLIGCSAHFIDHGVDTGPIIMQVVMPMVVFSVEGYDGVLDTQIEMLRRIIFLLNHDRIYVENGHVTIKDADYTKKTYFPDI